MTVREALLSATRQLELHHVSNARLQAEVILAHCLSADRTFLYTHDEKRLNPEQERKLQDAICNRMSGVPLQYIVGQQEFYGRTFRVTPDVLIPRPETEHIVEAVLETGPGHGARIIDIGTGSGCIAVTLALEIPGSEVYASDISERALGIARENAVHLCAKVDFICMDMLDALDGRFDYVVSNPPYVRPSDFNWLQREVRDFEPHVALFSPDEELENYRRIAAAAWERLNPNGHLIVEIGIGMSDKVAALLEPGWNLFPLKCDLQGIPRTIIAKSCK